MKTQIKNARINVQARELGMVKFPAKGELLNKVKKVLRSLAYEGQCEDPLRARSRMSMSLIRAIKRGARWHTSAEDLLQQRKELRKIWGSKILPLP